MNKYYRGYEDGRASLQGPMSYWLKKTYKLSCELEKEQRRTIWVTCCGIIFGMLLDWIIFLAAKR